MKGFRSVGGAQRFLAAFSGIPPHFRPRRHLMSALGHRAGMTIRFPIRDRLRGTCPRPAALYAKKHRSLTRSPYREVAKAMQSTPRLPRALGSGWTVTLAIDAVVTLVIAAVMAGICVLIPAFEEDYEMPLGKHLSEAAPLFGGMVLLVASLVVTALMVRSGPERRRRAGLVTAVVRLGCLVAEAVAFLVYGTAMYGV